MQPNRNLLAKAIEIIQSSQSGVICLSDRPTEDSIAAATALYMGLTKLGKNVSLASPAQIQSPLSAADKVEPNISTSGDNLVISFPYQDGAIDKVDYFIQGDRFNIVLVPGQSDQKVDPQNVKFSYSGGKVDFIITLDSESPRSLGALFSENQDLFKNAKIINIDRHLTNTFFGAANIVNKAVSSTSELALSLLESMKAPLDREIATNLYAGLVAATNNFSSFSVGPSTFEAAAYLLKLGAQKKAGTKRQEQPVTAGPVENQVFSGRSGATFEKQNKPIEEVEIGNEGDDEDDWLKPKIFTPKNSGGGENS